MLDLDVRYINKDGSTGAYSGRVEDGEKPVAFLAEIEYCLSCGYEFTATCKPVNK